MLEIEKKGACMSIFPAIEAYLVLQGNKYISPDKAGELRGTMLDFKQKKAIRLGGMALKKENPTIMHLNEERDGWYEGTLNFKRVVYIVATGKYEYRDTIFVAQCKSISGIDCYNRIVDYLRDRVDSRSQFPSAKGKNFNFRYLGMWK